MRVCICVYVLMEGREHGPHKLAVSAGAGAAHRRKDVGARHERGQHAAQHCLDTADGAGGGGAGGEAWAPGAAAAPCGGCLAANPHGAVAACSGLWGRPPPPGLHSSGCSPQHRAPLQAHSWRANQQAGTVRLVPCHQAPSWAQPPLQARLH